MLTFEVPLIRVRRVNPVVFEDPRTLPSPTRVSPMARSLILGHRIVRALETEEVGDFRAVARSMGVSHTRVSVLVALTFLSPRIQEAILSQTCGLGFHPLLRVARTEGWRNQETLADQLRTRESLWGATSRIVDPNPENAADSRPETSRRGPEEAETCAGNAVRSTIKGRPRRHAQRLSP